MTAAVPSGIIERRAGMSGLFRTASECTEGPGSHARYADEGSSQRAWPAVERCGVRTVRRDEDNFWERFSDHGRRKITGHGIVRNVFLMQEDGTDVPSPAVQAAHVFFRCRLRECFSVESEEHFFLMRGDAGELHVLPISC